jgi:hypothetical protein
MCKLKSHEPHYEIYIELAVAVFKTQDKTLIDSLKNFLTTLPNAQQIEDVLKLSICQLAQTDLESCRWLVKNCSCLETELNVTQFMMESVISQFQNQGFILNRDFWFESGNRLHVSIQKEVNSVTKKVIQDPSLLEAFVSCQKYCQS